MVQVGPYPSYQQATTYSCLAPYPPSTFPSYQDPLSLASYTSSLTGPALPSPDSCIKPEFR